MRVIVSKMGVMGIPRPGSRHAAYLDNSEIFQVQAKNVMHSLDIMLLPTLQYGSSLLFLNGID